MKVRIGDLVIDSEKEPVMVILSDADKRNIAAMDPSATKYVSFPETMETREIEAWMDSAPRYELRALPQD